MDNRSVFSISSKLEEIELAVNKLEQFCKSHSISGNTARKFYITMDEILSNIIHYAHDDDKSHCIEISLEYNKDRGILSMGFTDEGIPFNPSESPVPELKGSLEERKIGGLGIHIAKNLMDSMDYRRTGNRNIFIVSKNVQI